MLHVIVSITLPIAFIALVIWSRRQAHRQRRVPGTCQWCGYDLAGLPSARCPECGEAPCPLTLAEQADVRTG